MVAPVFPRGQQRTDDCPPYRLFGLNMVTLGRRPRADQPPADVHRNPRLCTLGRGRGGPRDVREPARTERCVYRIAGQRQWEHQRQAAVEASLTQTAGSLKAINASLRLD